MTKFNINAIFFDDSLSSQLVEWLETNVGAPKLSTTFNLTGYGWSIDSSHKWVGDPSKTSTITMTHNGQSMVKSYELTIEDDEKATLFALKWL